MRIPFKSLFQQGHNEGKRYLSPTEEINIGKVVLNQKAELTKGTTIDGIDFHDFRNHDFEVEYAENRLFLIGIYKRPN